MKRLTNAEKAEIHKELEEAEKAKFKPYENRIAELKARIEKQNADILFLKHLTEELEAQIEKMKCCGNCENRYGQEKCADCHNYNKWKFKQAEQFYEEIAD